MLNVFTDVSEKSRFVMEECTTKKIGETLLHMALTTMYSVSMPSVSTTEAILDAIDTDAYMREFLAKRTAALKFPDGGQTALHYAIQRHTTKIVKVLIERYSKNANNQLAYSQYERYFWAHNS